MLDLGLTRWVGPLAIGWGVPSQYEPLNSPNTSGIYVFLHIHELILEGGGGGEGNLETSMDTWTGNPISHISPVTEHLLNEFLTLTPYSSCYTRSFQ